MANTLQLGERARNLGWRLNLPRQKNSERSENQKTGRASMEVAKAPSDRGMPKLARCLAGQSRSTKNSSRSKQQRNDCNELYLFLTRILKDIKHNFTLYYSNSKTFILSVNYRTWLSCICRSQAPAKRIWSCGRTSKCPAKNKLFWRSCSPAGQRSSARRRRYYFKKMKSRSNILRKVD